MKIAVVLFNLGGPDSLDAIEPFLFNLFSDKDIFKIPFAQKTFAKIISSRRAPKVAEEYKLIGGKSPINMWTEEQRIIIQKLLRLYHREVDVYTAMRYWRPFTQEIVNKIEDGNYDRIILLPLYPHYSISTTGSSYNEWMRHYNGDKNILSLIKDYPTQPKYIAALNQRIDEALEKFPMKVQEKVQLVFSAHGTPVSLVKKGDPYSNQIKDTVSAVMSARKNSHQYHLCFQSKVGPNKWLEPATDDMIKDLSVNGKKHLLIIPISFVSDHVETLFELDIEYRHVADECGIENYIMMRGLNDSTLFLEGLTDLVNQEILRDSGVD
ncbi:MAG: ferrochelatase [Ignavibacteria bacterium]|nr:MAG: ferrochelatase [Ignavibacteria bacterium]KAF0161004.1 MAG: ferrochelatase [Ignavibacteria bacterium]